MRWALLLLSAAACTRAPAEELRELAVEAARDIPRLVRERELDEAMTRVEEVIAIDPTFAWAHYEKGAIHYEMGQFEETVGCTTTAIELDPLHIKAREFRGNSWANLYEHERAVADYSDAIAIAEATDEAIFESWGYTKRGVLLALLDARGRSLDYLARDDRMRMEQLRRAGE